MKLKAFLKDEGLTLIEFGRRVGVRNKQTMSRYVNLQRRPPLETIIRIEAETAGRVRMEDFVETEAA